MIVRMFANVALLLCATCAAYAQTPDDTGYADVIEQTAALLEERYVYPDRGRELAAALRRDSNRGRWPERMEPEAFAKAVTQRMRELSGDGHLALDYSARALDEDDTEAGGGFTAAEKERWYGPQVNHGFESVERLDAGIGYLDLRVFAPTEMAADMAEAAMTLLAQSPALIIDLRSNGGGFEDMVALLAGYLLDGTQPLSGTYHRPSDRLTPLHSRPDVPGRRFGGEKPLYILTSNRTFSAAEHLAYDLQALGRAVIVGEPSGGGAHPFENRRVGRHFVLALPESRSVNPITGTDWEGRGVQPDVPAPADQALEVARKLAEAQLPHSF